ncbi:FAD-dependent monooxygenase apdD isoform X2 [Manihot esculenta]|uniref:FAD-binding domain-containing protein n=1 Tax=Manihot esculenta TaxID=3983 RepID=A0A2C9UN41_MANES|nr:FAD-dependent monooxygenase apdD isoform X2 [Manihot esculenta]OAY32417.1 hypothetical protein MANES_13G016100v8 [Manihot esculenta]
MGVSGFIKGLNGFYGNKPRIKLYPFGFHIQSRELSHSQDLNADDSILPVLIIGAGPVGLVLSIFLTKLGVKCAILEKSKTFSNHPQAHFINNRSMEVFRKLDGLAEEIQISQPPVELWRKFIYCTSLTGPILGSVDHMQPQDGAGSTIRKLAGIELRGEKDLQKLVSIHFFSRGLGQYLLNKRPGMLFFVFNTEAIGVLVAHDLEQGEFVLQVPFYPPQQNVDDFSLEICEKLIFKLVGQELSDIDVIEIKPWVMHAEVAEKFVSCDNRIILAGDAAHRFPPAGGFGMNTGIQDAHNLAWKIASVMKGIAPSSIIRTYEMERRPIAIFNTALSVQNFRAAMAVPAALGIDPSFANSVHQVINDGVGSILPSSIQKTILEGIFTIGRAQLAESLLNEKNPLGSSRLAKVRRIFEEGKSLQLQFPAEDLGFRYLEGAVVPDNDSLVGVLEPPTGRRRDYIPSANPGSRLPHIDVRVLSNSSSEVTVSTLDLVCGDKVEFLLIVAPLKESYKLARAAFKVAEEFKVSAKVCVLWPADSLDEFEVRSKKALAPWEKFIDVVEVRKSSNPSSWWSMCQMTEKAAILVRPDEHIAWRVKSGVDKDPVSEMRRVFSAILGAK